MDKYIGLCELCSSPEPCNQCLGLLLQEKVKIQKESKLTIKKLEKPTFHKMIELLKETP